MTKRNTTVEAILEAPAHETLDDLASAFGPLVPAVVKAPKKSDLRDYQKTPEVNALLERFGNKSRAIRGLHKEGFNRGQIADQLRICYQFVNNVLNQK
jgi:DNA-binding NarL/FixJ family response regulator